MKIKELDKQLSLWIQSLNKKDRSFLLARLSSLKSAYPFNEYEYRLMFLLNKKIISFKDYENLRNNYVQKKPYSKLFGIAPRTFGGIWGENHIIDIDSRFKKPSKKIDPSYEGEYDLHLKKDKKRIIKIEVKACRATKKDVRGKLEEKALDFKAEGAFWMNFQQLKLDIVDAFIFIGVWTDKILYWVLTNNEVKEHPIRSHQHRGGIEYQIGITDKNIKQFSKYLVKPKNLVKTIINKISK